MARFIKKPNLPKTAVRGCIVSPQISDEIKNKLLSFNIEPFHTRECRNLLPSLAAHPDMLCHHGGGELVFLEKGQQKLFDILSKRGFKPVFIEKKLEGKYPLDIPLNSFCLNSRFFANIGHTSRELLSHYENIGKRLVQINQGYAKCSTLILSEKAVICDDEGIANACLNEGIDALLIEKGDITLEGFPYGFIGGCGGLIDVDRLALFGELDYHRDGKNISAFANKHRVEIVPLAKGSLLDYGGLLPILEEDTSYA